MNAITVISNNHNRGKLRTRQGDEIRRDNNELTEKMMKAFWELPGLTPSSPREENCLDFFPIVSAILWDLGKSSWLSSLYDAIVPFFLLLGHFTIAPTNHTAHDDFLMPRNGAILAANLWHLPSLVAVQTVVLCLLCVSVFSHRM